MKYSRICSKLILSGICAYLYHQENKLKPEVGSLDMRASQQNAVLVWKGGMEGAESDCNG